MEGRGKCQGDIDLMSFDWVGWLGGLVLPLGYFLWRMKTNDIKHISKRLDVIEERQREDHKQLIAQMNKHLEWHLNEKT